MRVGNWFAMDSDGGTVAGSAKTFTTSGTPVDYNARMCPNGPACAGVWRRQYDSSSFSTTAAAADVYTDFSVCWVGSSTQASADVYYFNKWKSQGSSSDLVWALLGASSATPTFYVATGSAFTAVTGGTITYGARHIICGTYDFVADGSSLQILYLDGVSVGSSSSAHGPPGNTNTATTLNANGNGLANAGDVTEGVFFTETVLTPTQIANIAHAVLADNPTWGADALVNTRTGLSSCPCDSAHSCESVLPTGRVCIGASGGPNSFQGLPASVNRALWSDLYSSHAATWVPVGTPAFTNATGGVAPNGLYNVAQAMADDSSSVREGIAQTVATVVTGRHSLATKAMGVGVSSLRLALRGTGDTAGDATCDFYNLPSTWRQYSCTSTNGYGTDGGTITAITASILYGADGGDTGSVVLTDSQYNSSNTVGPYCQTNGSTCSTGLDQGLVASTITPAGFQKTEGCMLGCYTPNYYADDNYTSAGNRHSVELAAAVRFAFADDTNYTGILNTIAPTNISTGVTYPWWPESPRCMRVSWTADGGGASIFDFQADSSGNQTSATFTSLDNFSALYLGSDSTAAKPMNGQFGSLAVGPSASACAQGIQWAFLGDSITAQPVFVPKAVAGWPRSLQPLWGLTATGKWVKNYALSGAISTDMQGQLNKAWDGGAGSMMMMAGTNDISNGMDAGFVVTNLTTVFATAQASGFQTVVLSITPFGTSARYSPSNEATRQAINASLSAWAAANHSTFINFDLSPIACGSPLGICPWFDSGDGLHPNQPGSDALAAYVYASVP